MQAMVQFFRLLHIYFVLTKYGLDKLLWTHASFRSLTPLLLFFPWRWFKKTQAPPTGQSIRFALEALGPLFVKFGQLLSIRNDLLPDEVASELTKLQDKVPPFSGEQAKKMIEKQLGYPTETLFKEFHATPLASASIAQVHSATLFDDTKVVVKVLRPKIRQHIKRDIALLQTMAKLLFRWFPTSRRFRPIEVVEELKSTLYEELDLLREAANASQLRRNFLQYEGLYIPQVFWQYTCSQILVTERVHGIHILDLNTLVSKGTNLKKLAELGVEIFFTQVFRDCFFHADMHPGNLFINIQDPENPKYIAVDFGIMGSLSPADQHYLGENFLAFFKRDYRRVAQLHVQSGWIPPHTRVEAFESAIRTVCEPIFERPLKEISIGQTLLRLFQTARQFDMQIQPQLVLLQKTLLTVEGLGRQLYPELDLWKTAKPFLEKWMKKQFGIGAFLHQCKNQLPVWTKLLAMPEALHDIVLYWQHETHARQHQKTQKKLAHQELIKPKKKHFPKSLLGIVLIIGASLLAYFHTHPAFYSLLEHTIPWLTGILLGIGLLFLLI